MQTDRSNIGALIGGALLIIFGLFALAGNLFPRLDWGFFWPFIIIGIGALFFVAMFAGGKQTAAFAIPGSIVGGIGLVLLFENITHHWESMSYFWTLILTFVGLGIYIMGRYGGDATQKKSGLNVMKVGLIMFVIFSSFGGILFPVLLIGLGSYLMFTRSGLLGGKKSDTSDSVPPASGEGS